ncbi:MAG: DNA-methyltransferase [Bacilli bacterium]
MLYNDDCIKVMKTMPSNKIDMVFADPPYFLSNGGLSIHNGRVVSVNKGEWDKASRYEDISKFNYEWLSECYRLLKVGGTIWVSGTQHNIFDVQQQMKKIGFRIINIIIWHKIDPPPLIYKNKFRFSYEFIIWASKGKNKTFNYKDMFKVNNEEMQDVWNLSAVQINEKKFGYHPTQKPECLLDRIIISATNEKDIVLDPFMGSGTTGYVAKKRNRIFIGIEKEKKYFDIAKNRINSIYTK